MFASILEKSYLAKAYDRQTEGKPFSSAEWKAKGANVRRVAAVEMVAGVCLSLALQAICVLGYLVLPLSGASTLVATFITIVFLITAVGIIWLSIPGLIESVVGAWKVLEAPVIFEEMARSL